MLDFTGNIKATAVASLREEITAILDIAAPKDEIILRLESAGGTISGYGLASSQLLRIKDRGIKLTVIIDKVAASGGYLMAAVADKIIAAPFAVIGSIGVIAQLPNFHRFLEDKKIDFEQITAGKFKRTLSVFGKNSEDGREKFQDELTAIHSLFKDHVVKHRPSINIEEVATGEYWLGVKALAIGLVDALGTSDDYLQKSAEKRDIYQVCYKTKKSISEALCSKISCIYNNLFGLF